MEKHIMGENGISYTLGEDGLYYPDLHLPEETEYSLGNYFALQGQNGSYEADSVILAAGLSNVNAYPGEEEHLRNDCRSYRDAVRGRSGRSCSRIFGSRSSDNDIYGISGITFDDSEFI